MLSLVNKGKKVFVGLSGGVDSSVAALRLIKQGYDVVGVFIKVWQPDFLQCNWEDERLDAMRVAAYLGIPFLTCDAEEEYRTEVGEYFVSEYIAGRTPNPDVMCNRYVKFGAFWKFAQERGADFIATGHYAQVKSEVSIGDSFTYKLLRGKDTNKDQSYFLWTLTQEDLSHTLFPVGNSTKDEIRLEAKKSGLPTAVKKDSQGICFLGHVDIKEFLSHFTTIETGRVLDTQGEEVGTHEGALIYTLGQRHGFTVFGEKGREPHYVVGKDVFSNVVIVDTKPPILPEQSGIKLINNNVVGGLNLPTELEAQFRYRQTPFVAKIIGNTLTSDKELEKPAIGQSVVFYLGEECLGGAVVA